MKVVQIDGFRGIITALFIGACLFAGFVVFPGMVAMSLWNKYLASLFMFPVLNILQGVLLWGIIAITYCILSKKGLAISFKDGPSLSDAEFDTIMRKAKINSQINLEPYFSSSIGPISSRIVILLKKCSQEPCPKICPTSRT